jgi:hypothetical protein
MAVAVVWLTSPVAVMIDFVEGPVIWRLSVSLLRWQVVPESIMVDFV